MQLQNPGGTVFIGGLTMTAAGVLATYVAEQISFKDSTSLLEILFGAAVPVFGLGLLVWIVGSVMLMIKENSRTCYKLATSFAAVVGAAALFASVGWIQLNVHDWSGMLVFPFMLLVPFGFAFLIAGALKSER